MPFPISITYTCDIAPHITSQDTEEVMNIIEEESLKYGKIKCTRDDNTLTIKRRFFALRPRGSHYLFDCVDYATFEIDTNSNIIIYNFHVIWTVLFSLIVFIVSIVLEYRYESQFLIHPIIPIGLLAAGVCITIYRLERYTAKITDKINAVFEKEEEVEGA